MTSDISEKNQLETDGSTDIESEKTAQNPGESLQTEISEDVPPDGGYGWVCVVCVFLINAHTWGVNSVCVCDNMMK